MNIVILVFIVIICMHIFPLGCKPLVFSGNNILQKNTLSGDNTKIYTLNGDNSSQKYTLNKDSNNHDYTRCKDIFSETFGTGKAGIPLMETEK